MSNMYRTSIINTIIVIFSLSLMVLGCAKKEEKQELIKISVRLPIPVIDAAFAPFYLAQDKGFFKKHGLEVKLEPGSPELNPPKMVAQGADQFGIVGGPELLMTARSKGVPLVGIALLHKNSNFVVVLTKKASGLTKLQDLQNKKVGFYYGHISTDVLHSLFNKEKVKVNEVDVGFDYGLFIADKIDAEWAFRTTAGLTLPAKGVEVNVISPADYGIATHGFTLITNEKTISADSNLVKNFLAAVIEATEYSLSNKNEAIASLLKRDAKFNKEVADKQLEIYESVIKNNEKIGWIDMHAMEETKKRLLDQKILAADIDLNKVFNSRFLEEYYSKAQK